MSAVVASVLHDSPVVPSDSAREQPLCVLTEKHKKILQETWKVVEPEEASKKVGLLLFRRIFEIAPGAIALFPKFKDVPSEEREENQQYREHAFRVIEAVGLAISYLNDLESLGSVLEDLGSVHAVHGVKDPHFEVVGEALLWTLHHEFQQNFTKEIHDAWATFYGYVAEHMKRGLHSAYEAIEHNE